MGWDRRGGDGTSWSDPENWSGNALPGADDDVTINAPSGPTILLDSAAGSVSIHSLVSNDAITLSGSLTVATTFTMDGQNLTLSGGVLQGGVFSATGGAELVCTSAGGVLVGITAAGNVDLMSNAGASVFIADGLTLDNATIWLGNPSGLTAGTVLFYKTQTVGGTGDLVFGGEATRLPSMTRDGPMTLTIGPGITAEGSSLRLAGSDVADAIVNEGTIIANTAGGMVYSPQGGTMINTGILEAANGGILSFGGTCTNSGTVEATNGGAVIFAYYGVTTDGQGTLTGDGTGSLSAATNLLGNTTNAVGYNALETVTLNGSGTQSSPQLLEAMSNDLGALEDGFTDNFAYNNLALANNTYVRLVDQANNSGSGAPEAVYANTLTVPTGCTLDLNGLHVYARTAQIDGTVTGGTITTLSSNANYALIDPISPHLHGIERVQWVASGVDVTGMTADVSATSSEGSTPVAVGASAIGNVYRDTAGRRRRHLRSAGRLQRLVRPGGGPGRRSGDGEQRRLLALRRDHG